MHHNKYMSKRDQLTIKFEQTTLLFEDQVFVYFAFFKTDSLTVVPTLATDDGLPVVSMEKSHLPVFARFPFDVTVSVYFI